MAMDSKYRFNAVCFPRYLIDSCNGKLQWKTRLINRYIYWFMRCKNGMDCVGLSWEMWPSVVVVVIVIASGPVALESFTKKRLAHLLWTPCSSWMNKKRFLLPVPVAIRKSGQREDDEEQSVRSECDTRRHLLIFKILKKNRKNIFSSFQSFDKYQSIVLYEAECAERKEALRDIDSSSSSASRV